MAKSLMDDDAFKSIGSKDKGGEGKAKSVGNGMAGVAALKSPKTLIAVGIIAVAVGWLGYFYVLGPRMERARMQNMVKPLTPEQQQAVQEQAKRQEKLEKDPNVSKGGA